MATKSLSPLRRRMIEDMTLRNLSPSTQQSYLYAVTNFSRHFGRSPDKLGLEDGKGRIKKKTRVLNAGEKSRAETDGQKGPNGVIG